MQGGIDEAGRGPVLGPLVVAAVAGDPAILAGLGCKDSKLLSPARRERLARLICNEALVAVRSLPAEALDQARQGRSLNVVEAEMFVDVACELVAKGATHFVVDAVDVDAARFGALVSAGCGVPVEGRHRADGDDPCTAAASIVAKVTRDQAIFEMARRLERRLPMPMGSGYPSDPATKAFLEAWRDRFGGVPPGTRRSWRTTRELLAPQQVRLSSK